MFVKRRKSLGNKRNEFNEECIENIIRVYQLFETNEYTLCDKYIASKIMANDEFKYFKVTVETPLFDEESSGNRPDCHNGLPKFKYDKKGNIIPDKDKRDTENIPFPLQFGGDKGVVDSLFDDYMKKNVLPYNKHAYIDKSKTKIGYEIPFTRLFYKYKQPRDIDEILNNIKELIKKENALMKELLKQ
jgi:type I restriction enzyme M protein